MKFREREIARGLTAILLGFHQGVVNAFHSAYIMLHIGARKFRPFKRNIWISHQPSRFASRSASFFAILKGATPELIERVISRGQSIEVITLCKIQRAIVAETFQMRFETKLCIVWRPLQSAVEIDIELDLEPANIVLNAHELFFDGWLNVETARLHAFAAFFRQPG